MKNFAIDKQLNSTPRIVIFSTVILKNETKQSENSNSKIEVINEKRK